MPLLTVCKTRIQGSVLS